MAPLPKPELRPLSASLRDLRKKADLTQEELVYAVRDHGYKMTAGTVSQIENERIRPERETMEALAQALKVDPQIWIEYRLALGRSWLDDRVVGAEQAAANVARLEGVLDGSLLRAVTEAAAVNAAAGRRQATAATRKAAARKKGRRQPGTPPRPQEGPDEKPDSGQAA